MFKLDIALVLPLLAAGMVLAVWVSKPLPDIYATCVKHSGLPISPELRFCVDNNRIVHYYPPRG
jgi:hypothetical protein